MEGILEVPAVAFQPAPEVESALVRMAPYRLPPHRARDEQLFSLIVRSAFAQRRKTLRNALRGRFGAADFAQMGIDPGLRAQELPVADFTRMANYAAGFSQAEAQENP
jgi:16S rRNA (adenine1518-N6/adenine1519-N6)-dimethyltransferase